MGSAIGGVVGAVTSENIANRSMDQAQNARRSALEQWAGLNAPSIAEQELNLEGLTNVGDFQAQLESALGMGPSAMEGVSVDPVIQQAQMNALAQLSEMGQTGLTPAEQAALNQSRRAAANEAQAKGEQILSDMARRGMGGSGAELAARLQASQSAADRQSQENDRALQMAQERALNSISQSGNLATALSGQQFGQKSDVAKAQDFINQFNTQNQQNVQQRNVGTSNAANLRNLQTKQDIANQNVGLRNAQQEANKRLIQQQFNNRTALAAGRSGQYAGIANATQTAGQDAAARNAGMWGNIGKGVDTAAGSYFANQKDGDGGFSTQEENDWLEDEIF